MDFRDFNPFKKKTPEAPKAPILTEAEILEKNLSFLRKKCQELVPRGGLELWQEIKFRVYIDIFTGEIKAEHKGGSTENIKDVEIDIVRDKLNGEDKTRVEIAMSSQVTMHHPAIKNFYEAAKIINVELAGIKPNEAKKVRPTGRDILSLLIEYNFGSKNNTVRENIEHFLTYIRRETPERRSEHMASVALGRMSIPPDNFVATFVDMLVDGGFIKEGELSRTTWTEKAEKKLLEIGESLGLDSKPFEYSTLPEHTKWA